MTELDVVDLSDWHRLEGFNCGQPALNQWLVGRAMDSQRQGLVRVRVAHVDSQVVAYYTLGLAMLSIKPVSEARWDERLPHDIPAFVIGQLAVDSRFSGRGMGSAVVRHAFQRCVASAEDVAANLVVARAIDYETQRYWLNWGFTPIEDDWSVLTNSIERIRTCLPEDLDRKTIE